MHSFIWKIWKYRNCKGQWVISHINSSETRSISHPYWSADSPSWSPDLSSKCHQGEKCCSDSLPLLMLHCVSSHAGLCGKVRFSLSFFSFLINHFPFNPLIPVSDQDRISPYNINTKSRRKVMSTRKSINWGIISWSNTKFSEVTREEFYSRQ